MLNRPPIEPAAVFVYGTLRPTEPNAWLWKSHRGAAIHDGEARLAGWRLIGNLGWFPYCVPGSVDDVTVGALIVRGEGCDWPRLVEALDWLEGVPWHYDRLKVNVETPTGVVTAWVYTPSDHTRATLDERSTGAVPGNDWVKALAAWRADMETEWALERDAEEADARAAYYEGSGW